MSRDLMPEPGQCQTCVYLQPRKRIDKDLVYINWCGFHGMTVKPIDTCEKYEEAGNGNNSSVLRTERQW